jgi:hypothetical protein
VALVHGPDVFQPTQKIQFRRAIFPGVFGTHLWTPRRPVLLVARSEDIDHRCFHRRSFVHAGECVARHHTFEALLLRCSALHLGSPGLSSLHRFQLLGLHAPSGLLGHPRLPQARFGYCPSARPATVRRASCNGRSASPAICTGSHVESGHRIAGSNAWAICFAWG